MSIRSRLRIFSAVIIVSISVFYLGWQDSTKKSAEKSDKPAHPQADYFIKQSHVKDFATDGLQTQSLTAEFTEHLPTKQRLELQNPHLQFYTDGNITQSVTSNQAEMPDKNKHVEFIGNVIVRDLQQPQQQQTLKTETLTVYTEKKLAQTAAKVTISDQSGRTTGVGMEADFNANTVELQSQVKGLHYVN
ncbi:LPS export ABC transporter periplasmic protein LptC [Aliamphritea hakodatensis]|uniref:LPS export ABC transporter periplasmic protein LptC n=1 Tax=Aliamphritea hakodatensis TaxID=2895352 RepID=UPI0022FD8B72|nr:LPS export ABC transporter periplasmic protein LptC [Aliamphritea hakodatensis]